MGNLVDVTVFLVAAVIAVPLFRALGLGATLGYLVAGVVIGPSVLGYFDDVERILEFAKIGVILLLFLVGLELAPSKLVALRRPIFGLGALQVVSCAAPIGAVALALGLTPSAAFLVALGLAFSSTAFALQALGERDELGSAHGEAAYAILLFKYLAILPLMAAVPLLGEGAEGLQARDVAAGALRTVAVLVGIIVGGHYLLRPVFRFVAVRGAGETFTATALLVVLASALIVDAAGLDMALGAFLAGVLLADSEYRHEIHASIAPFKGLLLGLFFVAVGMSADLGLLVDTPGLVLGLTLGLLALKLGAVYACGRLWGLGATGSTKLAAALPQGGELAFVLFSLALAHGVMDARAVDVTVAIVTLSMAATPLINAASERLLVPRLGAAEEERAYDEPEGGEEPKVVIVGFGRFGQILGRMLHSARIKFTALERDPMQVDFVRRYGHRVYYSDATATEALRSAKVGEARALVLALDDVEASVRIAETVRRHFPAVPIYAVARNRRHAWRLMDVGVDGVVREALATSVELGALLLRALDWTEEETEDAARQFREHDERVMAEQHAVRSGRERLEPTAAQLAHELENLFESDAEEPIDTEHHPAPPRRRSWLARLVRGRGARGEGYEPP